MTGHAKHRRPHTVRGAPAVLVVLVLTMTVMASGCGRYSIPSEGRTYDPRGLLEVFTQDDLGFSDDLTPASEELGGNPFGCDPGGCPTLTYIYPQDAPYTLDTCETWADTLEAVGYTIGAGYEGAPRVDEFEIPIDLESSFQPRCTVYAERPGIIHAYRASVQGLTPTTSQWEIQVVSRYD